jgi:hypothetical protein
MISSRTRSALVRRRALGTRVGSPRRSRDRSPRKCRDRSRAEALSPGERGQSRCRVRDLPPGLNQERQRADSRPSKHRFEGRPTDDFTSAGPGRGSKPHSGSGSIRLRALLDGQGNSSHRRSGLASGEAAVSPYPDGASGASPSPYHRAVSLLLRSSDSRPSGSHPTPCSPKWGLSSAAGRCRRGPPSAALRLLARRPGSFRGK